MSSTPFRDSLFNRCQSGFFFFLAAFALIIVALLLCDAQSMWLRERGRSALLLSACAAFVLGASLPGARAPWARGLWGAGISLCACALVILCRDVWPSESPLYAQYARLALATQWIALLSSGALGLLAGLASARAQDARFISRPKAIRAHWISGDSAPSIDRALALVESARETLSNCPWELQELDASGSARAYQPQSGLLLSIEPLSWDPQPAQGREPHLDADSNLDSELDLEPDFGAQEWIISIVWNPGLNPLRQLRGPRQGEDPAAAQSALLASLLAHSSVTRASALS